MLCILCARAPHKLLLSKKQIPNGEKKNQQQHIILFFKWIQCSVYVSSFSSVYIFFFFVFFVVLFYSHIFFTQPNHFYDLLIKCCAIFSPAFIFLFIFYILLHSVYLYYYRPLFYSNMSKHRYNGWVWIMERKKKEENQIERETEKKIKKYILFISVAV